MKHIIRFVLFIVVITMTTHGYSQNYKVKIGFIGNSITEGTGLSNPATQAFPNVAKSFLQQKYGDTCIVLNAGVSGRTLLKNGDFPIWREQLFKDCWQLAPDILFVMLGTNDSKPYNWEPYKNEFLPDYVSLIDTFLKRNSRTQLILAFPPPAFKESNFNIRDSVIRKHIIPVIDSMRKKYNAVLINFYKAFTDSDKFFPDNIHPNVAGAALMGKMVYDTIVKYDMIHKVDTGYTTVTSLKTTTPILANTDSAEISWTTLNAQTAYFEGEQVSLNGKIKVRASAKTTYKLVAKGKLSSDSLLITIDFYTPTLTRMSLSPGTIKLTRGTNVDMLLFFYDQKGMLCKNPDFTVNWTIARGQGTFSSKGTSSAVFVPDGTDTINVVAKVGDVTSNISKIIIKPFTEISNSGEINELTVYPNPASDAVNFKLSLEKPQSINIKIYDLKGAVKIQEMKSLNRGEQVFSVKTNNLVSGVYLYEVKYGGKTHTGKLNVVK